MIKGNKSMNLGYRKRKADWIKNISKNGNSSNLEERRKNQSIFQVSNLDGLGFGKSQK